MGRRTPSIGEIVLIRTFAGGPAGHRRLASTGLLPMRRLPAASPSSSRAPRSSATVGGRAAPPARPQALDAYIKLLRASETLVGRLQTALNPDGLTVGQLGVLEALLHLGPLSQRDLAVKLLRSSANVCTVVDNLERAGLVERQRSRQDRRVVDVHLTAAGDAQIRRVFPRHAAEIQRLLAVLDPAEQEMLAALCRKLGLGIQKLPPPRRP
jgi:MarR family 2-MHQ and catechol resistance regulon transcriptional repressor